MYRVALVNMPFASAALPSIALTQLRSVLRSELGEQVQADLFYVNHDFARDLGTEAYGMVAATVEAVTSGLGDWFFREQAFPQLPDNSEEYFRRHFAEHQRQQAQMRTFLLAKRRNLGAFLDELIERYRLDSYDAVGFTSMFSQNLACFAMARKLKERNPAIVTVLGGANCETVMGRVIARNVEAVDYVFSGPALKSFPLFVGRLLAGDRAGCDRIAGVYSRRKVESALNGGRLEIGEELDIDVDVPLDYEDFLASVEQLGRGVEPQILFETSRGCWWGERSHCTFCGLNGMSMKYRSMAPERALRTLQDLLDRYGARVARFQSVDNILPREYLAEVFDKLDTPD